MVVLSVSAYCKMMMHAAKYPHNAINGLLLAKKDSSASNTKPIRICDAIPLFHSSINLTPMAEIALLQVDKQCVDKQMEIVGYYMAAELASETNDQVYHRIATKVAENNPSAVLIVINNATLRSSLDNVALKMARYQDGRWKFVPIASSLQFEHDLTLDICSRLFADRTYHNLNDFDDKLDNIQVDWSNSCVCERIEQLSNC